MTLLTRPKTLFDMFRHRTMLLTRQEKPQTSSFTCFEAELSFPCIRKSRRRIFFRLFRGRTVTSYTGRSRRYPLPMFITKSTLPTQQKKPPTSSFTCLVLVLRFPHGKRSHRRPFYSFSTRSTLQTQQKKPLTSSFTCLVLDLRFKH